MSRWRLRTVDLPPRPSGALSTSRRRSARRCAEPLVVGLKPSGGKDQAVRCDDPGLQAGQCEHPVHLLKGGLQGLEPAGFDRLGRADAPDRQLCRSVEIIDPQRLSP